MKVTLLRIDSMGGSGNEYPATPVAYTDRETAAVVAERKNEEWTSYIPEEFEGEEIPGDRVIVNVPASRSKEEKKKVPRVFSLNRTEGAKAVLENALKKLTKREREVLGIEK
jgi:hypothetical protein